MVNRNLYYYYSRNKENEPPVTIVADRNKSVVSDLTELTESCDSVSSNKTLDVASADLSSLTKKVGRPKGTTNAQKRELKVQIAHAANFVSVHMKQKRKESELSGRSRVAKGCYDEIVKKARATFEISDDIPLKERCRQRVRKKKEKLW